MKKILATLAVVAAIAGATPALAQSANDWMRADEARDPGYQSAVRGGNYYGSGGYYNGPVVVDNRGQEGTCILLIICTNHARRNHTGDVCYDSNGVAYGLDRQGRWYQLPNSAPTRRSPGSVSTRCGWNSYDADSGDDSAGGK